MFCLLDSEKQHRSTLINSEHEDKTQSPTEVKIFAKKKNKCKTNSGKCETVKQRHDTGSMQNKGHEN